MGDLTASEFSLLLKVTEFTQFIHFAPGTWTKSTISILLVHDAGNDYVRPHHKCSEDFHSALISPSLRHCQLQESSSSRRLLVHLMALRRCLHWNFPLFSHLGRVGPKVNILKPLQRFPGVSRGNYCVQYASWCDNSWHAAAHDMEAKPFNSEEVRSQRCISAGKLVSFFFFRMD